jgi:class 3 adenylate cyclase
MQLDFDDLCNALSMTEIIRLQNMLSAALVKRFEQRIALAFSDIIGSTPYFARFGNEAGRELQQRHYDLLTQSLPALGGRIIDTAGDGAFLCFPTVDLAASSMIELLRLISAENAYHAREHQLAVRIGIHFGWVLTDGVQVTGDSANFCARITSTAAPGEIRLSKAAFLAFSDMQYRLNCRMLPPVTVKGIDHPVDLVTLEWRDTKAFPSSVRLETGEEIRLPDQDIITFGRLKEKDGIPANDIVLACRDEQLTLQISRWHFELRRRPYGFLLRVVTSSPLTVNDRAMAKGEEIPIHPGDSVRVGNVLGLQFRAAERQEVSSETVMPAGFGT